MPAKNKKIVRNLHSFYDFLNDPLISSAILVFALIALVFSILKFIAAVNA